MLPYAPWLCWIIPMVGAMFTLLFCLNRHLWRFRDHLAVLSIGVSCIFSFSMIQDIFAGNIVEFQFPSTILELSVLVDPLNVIMACVISCIGLFVTIFSSGFMRKDPNLTRFWFFIQLFIAGYIIVIMVGNLLSMFVGWEVVGICCTALTTFWYKDSDRAHMGFKVFMMLRIGDIALLISILLILSYLKRSISLTSNRTQVGWFKCHSPEYC